MLWSGAGSGSRPVDSVLWNDGSCSASGSRSRIFSCFVPAANSIVLSSAWVNGGGRVIAQPQSDAASAHAQFANVGVRTVGLMVHAAGVVARDDSSTSSGASLDAELLASVHALASAAESAPAPTLALPAASSLTDRIVVIFVSSSSNNSSTLLLHTHVPVLCSSSSARRPLSWLSLDGVFFPRASPRLPTLTTISAGPTSAFNCTSASTLQQFDAAQPRPSQGLWGLVSNGHLTLWGACTRTQESRDSASWRRLGKKDWELLFTLPREMVAVHGMVVGGCCCVVGVTGARRRLSFSVPARCDSTFRS